MGIGLQVAREATRRTRGGQRHEHFCSSCYGKSKSHRGRAYSLNGWWKCRQHPCTLLTRCLCAVHADTAPSQETVKNKD